MSYAGQRDAMLAAAEWVRDVLLGSVASSVAVVAVASVGLAMLAGRLDWRRGARIVLGCFIVFGSPSIAVGLLGLTEVEGRGAVREPAAIPSPAPLPTVKVPQPAPTQYDPYAGAAVPVR